LNECYLKDPVLSSTLTPETFSVGLSVPGKPRERKERGKHKGAASQETKYRIQTREYYIGILGEIRRGLLVDFLMGQQKLL